MNNWDIKKKFLKSIKKLLKFQKYPNFKKKKKKMEILNIRGFIPGISQESTKIPIVGMPAFLSTDNVLARNLLN